jgi:hypothetical protein
MQGDDSLATRRELLASHVPLLKDSVNRLDKVINALKSMDSIDPDSVTASTSAQSENIMNVVYNAANMLVSWDNFFGLRMQTALQADLSDTLWRKSALTDSQRQYFLSVGPELVTKLSGYYSTDPVDQRTHLSAAKVAQVTNLKAVEQQFAKVLFNEILSIDCKLEGGTACKLAQETFLDPATDSSRIANLNLILASGRSNKDSPSSKKGSGGPFGGFLGKWFGVSSSNTAPTDDSEALVQVKAKYCIQSLAFDSRDSFKEICKGAQLISDLTDRDDSLGLDSKFDEQLASVSQTLQSSADGRIDRARGQGVCAFRSYLRKNHVYYMYRDFNAGD